MQLSSTKKHAYYMAMQDLAIDSIQAACIQAIREESFFPVPVILREYAKAYIKRQREAAERVEQGHLITARDHELSQQQVRDLIASVWPEPTLLREEG